MVDLDAVVEWGSLLAAGPVEVAPRIWWVGPVLAGDLFQNHSYLIEAGEDSVLVDPGSTLTIDETLDKVRQIVPLDHIKWLLIHHSDPDVADALHRLDDALPSPETRIVTEWRSDLLMKHYASRFETVLIEDMGWALSLADGRRLEFVLTPYLHFPGAFVTYAPETATLFSADLFGGFNRARRLWATGPDDFEDLRQFHEHYMPSREILMVGLAAIRSAAPTITTICPQHGYVIPDHLVDEMFQQLNLLECGVFLQSRGDTHLAHLLEIAAALRHVESVLRETSDPTIMSALAQHELGELLPVEEVWIEVDADVVAPTGRTGGNVRAAPSDGPSSASSSIRFRAGDVSLGEHHGPWTTADDRHLIVPIDLDGTHRAIAVVQLREATTISSEISSMLTTLGPAIRLAAVHLVEMYIAEAQTRRLEDVAYRDSLTGVANRRALDERSIPQAQVGVLMVDIDHFKSVNDTFGHQVGDKVLALVAGVLEGALREGDLVYRYGGEEFVVVVEAADSDRILAVSERVRAAVAGADVSDLLAGRSLTVSVGAHVLDAGLGLDAGIAHADAALYRAKVNGRNQVVVD